MGESIELKYIEDFLQFPEGTKRETEIHFIRFLSKKLFQHEKNFKQIDGKYKLIR